MILILLKSLPLALLLLGLQALLRRSSAANRHKLTLIGFVSVALLPLLQSTGSTNKIQIPVTTQVIPLHFHQVRAEAPVAIMSKPSMNLDAAVTEVWAAGTIFFLCRLMVGYLLLWRLARSGAPLERDVLATDVGVPCTAWIGRSYVLVPRDFTEWNADLRTSVLLHERAHIRRFDWLAQLFSQLVCACFWPNLFLWVLVRQGRLLAEWAADEAVLAAGVRPATYAQHLIQILGSNRTAWLATPMARRSDIRRRIQMITTRNTRPRSAHRGAVSIAALVLLSALIPLASLALVAQKKHTPHKPKANTAGQQKPLRVPARVPSSLHASWVAMGASCSDCHRSGSRSPEFETDYQLVKSGATVELGAISFNSPQPFHLFDGQSGLGRGDAKLVTFATSEVDKIVSQLGKAGVQPNVAPRMRTRSGEKVCLQLMAEDTDATSRELLQIVIAATPTVLQKSTVMLRYSFVEVLVKPSDRPNQNKYGINVQADGEVVLPKGTSAALLDKRHNRYYLTMLTPMIVKN